MHFIIKLLKFYPPVDCKNLTSPLVKYLISLIPYLIATTRVTPIPNANPLYSRGSIPHSSRTRGCTIPAHKISIQPVCLQRLHHACLQTGQLASISNHGSVKGKYAGLNLTSTSVSKTLERNDLNSSLR
jgi:hypothetical protein